MSNTVRRDASSLECSGTFATGCWLRPLVVVAAVLLAVAPLPAAWIEELYSRGLYLAIQNALTPLTGAAPVALFDLLLAGACGGVAWRWWASIRRAGRGGRLRAALGAGWDTAVLLAAVYLVFLLAWGFNYRREPLGAALGFDAARVTPRAVAALAGESVERLNALHAPAHRASWSSLDGMPDRLGAAFERVQRQLGITPAAAAGPPKRTLLAPYFRRAGIDGMVSPFSLEILVNGAVLPFERPYVVAHEWAHLAGYADESEASFVGWLTCLAGDDASRYSAWLYLAPQLVRHLGEEERNRVWGALEPGPADDLRAVAARTSEAVPIVRRNASRVYDQYLRANRVESGVASYGKVVDLVLGTRAWWDAPQADSP